MRTHTAERVAAILVGLEGAALIVLAAWQIAALAGGDTVSPASAIALIVLTVAGAAIVLAFAVGVARGRSWGRSGGIVTQVLIVAVAIGAATGAYAHPVTGLVIALPAVVAFVLLVIAARDAGRAASVDETE
ncbi:MAG: histidine kinase [Microbacterium sp.]